MGAHVVLGGERVDAVLVSADPGPAELDRDVADVAGEGPPSDPGPSLQQDDRAAGAA